MIAATLVDSHTGRQVWIAEGRLWTKVGDEPAREIDTFTVRRLQTGGLSIVVAFAETLPAPFRGLHAV